MEMHVNMEQLKMIKIVPLTINNLLPSLASLKLPKCPIMHPHPIRQNREPLSKSRAYGGPDPSMDHVVGHLFAKIKNKK